MKLTYFSCKFSYQCWHDSQFVDSNGDLDDFYSTTNIKNEYSPLSITFTTRKSFMLFRSLENLPQYFDRIHTAGM
jgi:hypothetical protein